MRLTDPYGQLPQQHILTDGSWSDHTSINGGGWSDHIPATDCWCKPRDIGYGIWVHHDARGADESVRN